MEELAKLEEERGNPAYTGASDLKDGQGKGAGNSRKVHSEKEGGVPVRQRVASNEMCTFLILNISSLQLIPVNMIAYE